MMGGTSDLSSGVVLSENESTVEVSDPNFGSTSAPDTSSALRRSASWMRWRLSVHRRMTCRSLAQFGGLHSGETAVIIGNGPSLNETDLQLLGGVPKFILNRGYLLGDRLPMDSAYFVCVNEYLLKQWADEIRMLEMTKFLSWPAIRHGAHSGRYSPDNSDSHADSAGQEIILRAVPGKRVGFSEDPRQGIWIGATVTYAAMQLAYFMGFKRVVLIGVDHSFPESGTPNAVAIGGDRDVNHFSPDYFSDGAAWQYPDLQTSEAAYRIARVAFEKDGREIVDSTVGGRLKVFEKRSLADALGKL